MQSIPGGKTGLIVMTIKGIGTKDDFQVVREYRLDRELLAEMRAHEQQAAEELGQWVQRKETASASVNLHVSSPAQLNVFLKQELGALDPASVPKLLAAAPELAEYVDQARAEQAASETAVEPEGEPEL